MTTINKAPTFFPRRINMYVPAMHYAADMNLHGPTRISFGNPALAATTSVVNGVAATTGLTLLTGNFGQATSDARYGRNLTYALSGAGTPAISVIGQDFWGQTITENVAANGATPVVGLKAFMNLIQITCGAVAMNLNVGWGSSLGLPYKCLRVLSEDVNTSNAGFLPGTVGTLTPPVLTDPATVSTGDPRGTYVTNAALAVTKEIAIAAIFDNSINAAGNGGLMGIKGV
jgi:hypothetical protein